jgi:hypothetical protein
MADVHKYYSSLRRASKANYTVHRLGSDIVDGMRVWVGPVSTYSIFERRSAQAKLSSDLTSNTKFRPMQTSRHYKEVDCKVYVRKGQY